MNFLPHPDSYDFPLLLHILGAAVLVGAVATGAIASLASSASAEGAWLRRFAARTFLFVALPAYIVMRVGAQWVYSKGWDDLDPDPDWIGIGFMTADIGLVLLLIVLILSGFASMKNRPGLARASGVIAAILAVAWLVTVWAMAGKPG
jgi:hypothetical protein